MSRAGALPINFPRRNRQIFFSPIRPRPAGNLISFSSSYIIIRLDKQLNFASFEARERGKLWAVKRAVKICFDLIFSAHKPDSNVAHY